MKKKIVLTESINNENDETIATLQTVLEGDGSTPVVVVVGGNATIIGYKDDGSAIVSKEIDALIENKKKTFMASAIKEQKKLCVENGVDPTLVNMINAEKRRNERQ